jgi:hypothetical protein
MSIRGGLEFNYNIFKVKLPLIDSTQFLIKSEHHFDMLNLNKYIPPPRARVA